MQNRVSNRGTLSTKLYTRADVAIFFFSDVPSSTKLSPTMASYFFELAIGKKPGIGRTLGKEFPARLESPLSCSVVRSGIRLIPLNYIWAFVCYFNPQLLISSIWPCPHLVHLSVHLRDTESTEYI